MFSVTVLKGKDIFKFFIGISILIIIITIISKNLKKEDTNTKITTNLSNKISSITENNLSFCLDQILPSIDNRETVNVKEIKTENIYEDILKTQIASIREVYNEENDNLETIEKIQETGENIADNTNENKETEKAKTDVSTQVITQNPIAENANRQYGNVKIKNQTTYELTDEILNPDIIIDNKKIIL